MSSELPLRVPGTWGNGRVLKPEERQRKRDTDRATKRKAAVNLKASEIRIQALEQLVVELSNRIVNLETEVSSTRYSRTLNLDHAQIVPVVQPNNPVSWLPINTCRFSTPQSSREIHYPILAFEANSLSQPSSVFGNASIDLQCVGISENCGYVATTNARTPPDAYAQISPTLLGDFPQSSGSATFQSLPRNSLAPLASLHLNWDPSTTSHTYAPISSTLFSDIPTNSGSPTIQNLPRNSPASKASSPLNWDTSTFSYTYAPVSSALLGGIPINSGSPTTQNLPSNIPFAQGSTPSSWAQTDKFEALIARFYSLRGTNLVDKDHYRNEDLLIRGIVVGWDSVLQTPYGKLCPLWTIISSMDHELFYNRRTIIRLAFLRKIYRMIMVVISFLLM